MMTRQTQTPASGNRVLRVATPRIARPRATAERVAAACAQLGAAVSLRNVQRQLGGGSFSTLAPLVSAWRNRPQQPMERVVETLGRDVRASMEATAAAANLAGQMAACTAEAERASQALVAESSRWREEIAALRIAVDALTRQFAMATATETTNVVALGMPAEPVELNAALASLTARLDQLEHGIAERDAKLPEALKASATAVSKATQESAQKIIDVLKDLPQTLRQTPVSQIDAELNTRLKNAVFELEHRAADLAARHDRTDDVIATIERIEATAARRQTRQTDLAAATQGALLERLDAIVVALTARTKKRRAVKRASRKLAKSTQTQAPKRKKPARITRRPSKKSRRSPHSTLHENAKRAHRTNSTQPARRGKSRKRKA